MTAQAHNPQPPVRLGLAWLGWALLVLGLPIALLGASMPPNEYRATLGIDALDCDGPIGVYLFALPALVVYGAGFIINVRARRKPARLLVALVCAGLSLALAVNVTRAVMMDRQQAVACKAKAA